MVNLDSCNFTETTIQATNVVNFFTYYMVLPYYMSIGLILDILLIVALVRQTAIKVSYGYQLQLACARTFHCIAFGLSTGAMTLFGLGGSSTIESNIRSYWLVWFFRKVLLVMYNMAYFLSLLLSVVITCDRVFALASPFRYKALNHRRCQYVIGLILFAISGAMTADKYFAYDVAGLNKNGTVFYQAQANLGYVSAKWGQVSESLRIGIRGFCLIVLMGGNITMIALHRRRTKRLEATTLSNEERVQARREINRDLTILAACQSGLSYLDHLVNMGLQLLWQSSSYWALCISILAAEAQCTPMLVEIAEVLVFLVVNRQLRQSIPGYKYFTMLYSWLRANRVGLLRNDV